MSGTTYCTYTWLGNTTVPDVTPCIDPFLNATTYEPNLVLSNEFLRDFATAECTVVIAGVVLYIAIHLFRKI